MITMKSFRNKLWLLLIWNFLVAGPLDVDDYKKDIKKHSSLCRGNAGYTIIDDKFIEQHSFWFSAKNSFCSGYFKKLPLAISKNKDELTFKADKTSVLTKEGMSTLQGKVVITYNNMQLNADRACFFHNEAHSTADVAYAEGKVEFLHDNMLLLADQVLWYVAGGEYLQSPFFRLDSKKNTGEVAWGRAEHGWTNDEKEFHFQDASYSFCALKNPDWQLKAGSLLLNDQYHTGYATNVLFYLFDAPVFYLPVFSFPLNKDRMTGFLYPVFNFSDSGGWYFELPYYFNLAPNYDAVMGLNHYKKRGFGWQSNFRFLTEKSFASLNFMQWFHDEAFASFQVSQAGTYSDSSNQNELNLRQKLLDSSLNRKFFSYVHDYTVNNTLKLKWKYYWMSDDYMREDFDVIGHMLPIRRLPRLFALSYNNPNTSMRLNFQDDTLIQPLGQTILSGVFSAKPEIFIENSPNILQLPWFDFSQSIHFLEFAPSNGVQDNDTDNTNVKGNRIVFTPQIKSSAITPSYRREFYFGVNSLRYHWQNLNKGQHQENFMLIPWLGLDQKWSYKSNFSEYDHLLQPHLLLSYVPYRNQDNLLVLDSSLPVENYQQLFRINRFTGSDRVGDSKTIALGIENKWLDNSSGHVFAKLELGKSYVLSYHKTCLSADCAEDVQAHDHWSPWLTNADFESGKMGAGVSLSFDHGLQNFNNAYFDLRYKEGDFQKTKIYYHFARYLDLYPMNVNKFQILGGDADIKLTDKWSLFSTLQYDIANNHAFGYKAGIKYHSCCFDSKLGWERQYIGMNGNNAVLYKNSLIFKFYFNGLGGSS